MHAKHTSTLLDQWTMVVEQQQDNNGNIIQSSKNNNSSKTNKRFIRVCEPELGTGSVEYKRQVGGTNAARLRSLGTQMSYRMDQCDGYGEGVAVYQVGVEDNGCHSLLDYPAVSESCRILEYLAHSLNAVVTQRTMIQEEIERLENTTTLLFRLREPLAPFVFEEHSILGDGSDDGALATRWGNGSKGDEDNLAPRRQTGALTRATLRIQRIETHRLSSQSLLQQMLPSQEHSDEDETEDDSMPNNQKLPARAETGDATSHLTTATMDALKQPAAAHEQPQPSVSSRSSQPKQPPAPPSSKKSASTTTSNNIGETLSCRNVRIAVMGNVDAGKSTLIGTLTTSVLDDGRGKTRTSIMKHRHEIESGRTSTATSHILGFRAGGKPILGRDAVKSNQLKTPDQVAKEAYRIVTLLDLAGHEKFLKTTIHGISSGFCDYALVLVNSRQPPTHMAVHHLNLCSSFNIPVIVVFTKIDGCPSHAQQACRDQVLELLSQSSSQLQQPTPLRSVQVQSSQDVARVVQKLGSGNARIAPMVNISCVTGEGMDLLHKLFYSLPKRRRHASKTSRKFEFLVEDVFDVPGVGTVVAGFVNAGELDIVVGVSNGHHQNNKNSSCVFVGPTREGSYIPCIAKSAHICRIHTTHITSGQSASLALQPVPSSGAGTSSANFHQLLRRGMVVLQEVGSATMQFEAEICVLRGGRSIREPHQAHVHVLNVRQTAICRNIEKLGGANNNHSSTDDRFEQNAGREGPRESFSVTARTTSERAESAENDEDDVVVLQPGSRAKVRFEFTQRPEYVRPGMRLLFRDGRVRGVGLVTSVPPADERKCL